MLQLLKLRTALCLPAAARQASGPRQISPRSPSPHSSSPRKTSTKHSRASAGRFASRESRVRPHSASARRQLGSAVAAYNEAVGSFDSRVMPQVRRIEQAGAASERELEPPPPLEVTARAIASQGELEDRLQGELAADAPEGEPHAARLGPRRIVSGG